MTTFLEQATSEARERVAERRKLGYFAKLEKLAQREHDRRQRHRFRDAISQRNRINIIGEIKRASPSKGVIKGDIDVARLARAYAGGGAAAISVLTEPTHFDGSVSDLVAAARAVEIPVLRKDFIVDEYQIVEAAAGGASAVLLIVAALSQDELRDLHAVASDLGLDVLVEVHELAEMRLAAEIGAKIIGVNNRDLHSLQVSLDTSRRLIESRPSNVLLVAESGLTTRDEIRELFGLGYDAFLIGETLMRSTDVSETMRRLSE